MVTVTDPIGRCRGGLPRGGTRAWSTWILMTAVLLPSTFGGAVRVAAAEQPRLVVLGGSITEILYALHADAAIVGVDTTSLFPPDALRDKASVGYVRAVSAEGVLSLRPTRVLAIDGAGPPDALDLIRRTGVAFVPIADDPTPEGVAAKIDAIGAAVDKRDEATALDRTVASGFQALVTVRTKIAKPLRVLFVLSLQNGRSIVGGHTTAADGIIRLAGSINAAGAIEGYKTMTDEAIVAAAPDVILAMQNANHQMSPDEVFGLPAYAATPAAKTRALVAVDGLLLLGFGPRTPAAAMALIKAVYPNVEAAGP